MYLLFYFDDLYLNFLIIKIKKVKIFFKIVCLSIIISFYQCTQNKKIKRKSTEIKKKDELKKKIEKIITAPWDSLNKNNTESFLLAYGKKNPETKVVIKTKFGNIKLLLYSDVPVHRANFIFLTKLNILILL